MNLFRTGGAGLYIPGLEVVQAGADTSWWLAAGVTPVAAYAPKGAADLASSYINLANPGTNNAAPGVAPTWDVTNGWTFNASTQFLTTGIVAASGYSVIVRFTNAVFNATFNCPVVGSGVVGSSNAFQIVPIDISNANRFYIYGAGSALTGSKVTAGIMGLSGAQGYLNGAAAEATGGTFSGSGLALYIGALNNAGSAARFFNGKVQAVVIFSSTLDAAANLAMYNAMAAL